MVPKRSELLLALAALSPRSMIAAAAAVAIAVAAVAAQPLARVVNLPGRLDRAPYSDAVRAGDTVYLAGRLGLDPATNAPPADPAQEARLILEGMKTVLAQAGLTMDDLVSVQVFCSDVALLETFNSVYRTYFTHGYPARAFIGTGPLLLGARFEVQGIAVRRR
jgi:2-iminobutanoate/2-iminopropanoate deaminase